MNNLEKSSFYSFLLLYIVSSFLFIGLSGYWYYTAQKNALKNENYYRFEHIADEKSSDIIMAHMQGKRLIERAVPEGISLALIDTAGKLVSGRTALTLPITQKGYREKGDYQILISDAPREHLNIAYILVQSNTLNRGIEILAYFVLKVMVFSALLMVLIAWVLSKLFMRPLSEKIIQIESFINDISHELNTPITALTMATEQALKKEQCTPKMLKHISISTRQLYDIYSTLSYMNFSSAIEAPVEIDIAKVLEKSILYYQPICERKEMRVDVKMASCFFKISESELTLLYGNLIGNAIKYSPAKSTLTIRLLDGIFSIEDKGIGISAEKQEMIFKKFKRATEYSGGFGVGLTIVKRICESYNIEIHLDSILGEGSCFRLYFTRA